MEDGLGARVLRQQIQNNTNEACVRVVRLHTKAYRRLNGSKPRRPAPVIFFRRRRLRQADGVRSQSGL